MLDSELELELLNAAWSIYAPPERDRAILRQLIARHILFTNSVREAIQALADLPFVKAMPKDHKRSCAEAKAKAENWNRRSPSSWVWSNRRPTVVLNPAVSLG